MNILPVDGHFCTSRRNSNFLHLTSVVFVVQASMVLVQCEHKVFHVNFASFSTVTKKRRREQNGSEERCC